MIGNTGMRGDGVGMQGLVLRRRMRDIEDVKFCILIHELIGLVGLVAGSVPFRYNLAIT
jgi:hypothetical protein